MIRLALLRHGHTAWNRAGQIQGRTDIPLDPEACEHLAQLCLPPPWDQAALVSSPLERAVKTGHLVADRIPVTQAALTEMDWGAWEGQRGVHLLEQPDAGYRHIETWGWNYRPPGGESPDEVLKRLEPWVLTLSGDTVAVCHIGIMRVLLARATGWNFEGPAPFRIKRDRLFLIEVDGDNWRFDANPVRLKVRGA